MIQSVRIELLIRGPLIPPEQGVALDGLLAYARVQESRGDTRREILDDIPLGKAHGIFQGSNFALEIGPSSSLMHMIRRNPVKQLIEDEANEFITREAMSPNYDLGSGRHRSFLVYHPVVYVEKAIAYALTTDCERLDALLKQIPALGPIRRNGFGLIKKVSIFPDSDGETRWSERALPLETFPKAPKPGYAQGFTARRTPYWDRSQHELCWIWLGKSTPWINDSLPIAD